MVAGELWEFEFEHLVETLDVIDAIEGYTRTPHDLYHRIIIEATQRNGPSVKAFTYHYADTSSLGFQTRIAPIEGESMWGR